MLTFLCYYEDGRALSHVLASLDALSLANNEPSRYDYWFKSLDATLSGRGKMGSLVGASDEVRRIGGVESSLNDYAVRRSLISEGTGDYLTFLELSAKQRYPHRWYIASNR